MGIRVSWDNDEKTIIRFDFANPWTWENLYHAVLEANALARTVTHRVDVINDLSTSSDVPAGALTQFKSISRMTMENTGNIYLAGAGMLAKTMVSMFRKLYSAQAANWYTAPSVEMARRLIADDRASAAQ